MKTNTNAYIPVLHRIFYIHIPSTDTIRLALCLYNNTTFDSSAKCTIVNSLTGNTTELDKADNSKILSPRERQLLGLINKGMSSKDIASALFISVNTVS